MFDLSKVDLNNLGLLRRAVRGAAIKGHAVEHSNWRDIFKDDIYFLKCDENNRCWIDVTGKRCNPGDAEGM